jgi:uncharacterized protein (TIGR02597 family)
MPVSMKILSRVLFASFALAAAVRAQTSVATDPVGFVTTSLRAASDNNFGVPLHRASVLQTTITAVNGNVLSVAAAMTPSQFVYNTPAQTDNFYVYVISSATAALAGSWYHVTGNDATTITVISNSGSTLQAQGLASGDKISVIPFWTLNTLFPNGAGIDATTSLSSLKTQVFFLPQAISGTNLAAEAVYFYYGGSPGAGWYNLGTFAPANDQFISPESYVIIRNVGAAKSLTVTGTVPASGGGAITTPLGTLAAGKAQDNFVLNPLPIPLTLAQLKLYESGAFTPTTSISAVKDQLLLFDSTTTGYNLAASAVLFYYYAGPANAANGWYNLGTFAGPLNDTQLVAGGAGFIVRKAAAPSPSSVNWTLTSPY